MTLRSKVYGTIGVVALLGAGIYIYKAKPAWFTAVVQANARSPENEKQKKDAEKEATPVEVAVAERNEISAYLSSTANLRALRDVAVSTQAEGIVQKILAEEGDAVKEGQVLCTLDDTHLRLRLELANQKLAQARFQMERAKIRKEKTVVQMGHARAELSRYETARKQGLVSDKEVATYRYRLEELDHDEKVAAIETIELQHRMAELDAEIAQTNLDISRSQIRAPFAGFVTLRQVNLGQRVRPMDALFNVGALSPLYADVHLSERDTRNVHPSQLAAIRLGSDDSATVQGKVERISPIVDQSSGTVKVTITLEPKVGFRPGAFVRVDILTDKKLNAVLIPKRALIEEDGINYVYIANRDSAKRTKVQLGYQREGMIEILNGVSPGQSVVVAGQGSLKETSKIRIIATGSSQPRA